MVRFFFLILFVTNFFEEIFVTNLQLHLNANVASCPAACEIAALFCLSFCKYCSMNATLGVFISFWILDVWILEENLSIFEVLNVD